jgi:hypothetical protein
MSEGLAVGEQLWLDGFLGFEHRLDSLHRLKVFVIRLWSYVGWGTA